MNTCMCEVCNCDSMTITLPISGGLVIAIVLFVALAGIIVLVEKTM